MQSFVSVYNLKNLCEAGEYLPRALLCFHMHLRRISQLSHVNEHVNEHVGCSRVYWVVCVAIACVFLLGNAAVVLLVTT